jgi:uncharacterized protein
MRMRRLALGVTQSDLAARCGTSASNISAIESGKRSTSEKMRKNISRQLAAKPSVILQRNRDAVLKSAATHNISDVQVFGSIARGEDSLMSDVDLLVRLPRGKWSAWEDFKREVQHILGTKVDVVSKPNDLVTSPFVANAIAEAIPL